MRILALCGRLFPPFDAFLRTFAVLGQAEIFRCSSLILSMLASCLYTHRIRNTWQIYIFRYAHSFHVCAYIVKWIKICKHILDMYIYILYFFNFIIFFNFNYGLISIISLFIALKNCKVFLYYFALIKKIPFVTIN